MNNKGFAITGILYGLLILFIILLLSLLSFLNTKRLRLYEITNSISDTLNYELLSTAELNAIINSFELPYVIEKKGKYLFKINDENICSVYLPYNSYIDIVNMQLIIDINNSGINQELVLNGINCNNSNITSISIEQIYS